MDLIFEQRKLQELVEEIASPARKLQEFQDQFRRLAELPAMRCIEDVNRSMSMFESERRRAEDLLRAFDPLQHLTAVTDSLRHLHDFASALPAFPLPEPPRPLILPPFSDPERTALRRRVADLGERVEYIESELNPLPPEDDEDDRPWPGQYL